MVELLELAFGQAAAYIIPFFSTKGQDLSSSC